MVPSIISQIKNITSKPIKQPNEEINKLNAFLQENIVKTNSVRNVVSMKPMLGLIIQIGKNKLKDIAFAYDAPFKKNSLAEFALGQSNIDLPYWFGRIPTGDSLSDAFENPDSYIFSDSYLKSVLDKVWSEYIDTTGIPKLQNTLFRELDGRIANEKNFFEKAISGPNGASVDQDAFNIGFFFDGEPKFKMQTSLYGLALLNFSKDIITKSDLISQLIRQETCLVIESTQGSSIKIRGKTINNVSVGIYKKSYLNRLRDAIRI